MTDKLKNYALILASGNGNRFGSSIPKQFVEICGRTILERTLDIFEQNKFIDEIILVITPEYKDRAVCISKNYNKISKILAGGKERKDSSYIGICSITDKEANVLIHDCARPFLSQRVLNNCIEALKMHEAVDVAIKTTDTILEIQNGVIKNIPERKDLMCSQTPQCFKLSIIKKAHELAKNDKNFTDDCGLILKYNLAPIFIVEGEAKNIKITNPIDEYFANSIIENKNRL